MQFAFSFFKINIVVRQLKKTDELELASKYGFISAKLLAKEKKWSTDEFEHNILELRTKGILWIDKQVPSGPHYYFLSHLGADFRQFS